MVRHLPACRANRKAESVTQINQYGQYKTCNKCKQTKLRVEGNFTRRPCGKSWNPMCVQCREKFWKRPISSPTVIRRDIGSLEEVMKKWRKGGEVLPAWKLAWDSVESLGDRSRWLNSVDSGVEARWKGNPDGRTEVQDCWPGVRCATSVHQPARV